MSAVVEEKFPRGVPLHLLFGAPGSAFDGLRHNPSIRRPLLMVLLTFPIVPTLMAVVTVGPVREALLDDGGAQAAPSAAPMVAFTMGVVVFLVQLVMLAAHFAFFALSVRVAGTRSGLPEIRSAWFYAIVPLILRQVLYVVLAAVNGAEWYAERSSIVAFIDPFVAWSAVLLFLAARRTLGLSRAASWIVCLLSSGIGLIGALPGLLS